MSQHGPAPDLEEIRVRLLAGAGAGEFAAMEDAAGRALRLAAVTGAPSVAALDAAIAAESDRRRRERALAVATAQSRTVAAVLVALPVAALFGIGWLVDEPLWRFYLTGAGPVVGLVSAALIGAGAIAVAHLQRRAGDGGGSAPRSPLPAGLGVAVVVSLVAGPPVGIAAGLVAGRLAGRGAPGRTEPGTEEAADLLASAVSAGLAPSAALRETAAVLASEYPGVAIALRRAALGHDLQREVAIPDGVDRTVEVLLTATHLGAPCADVLRRLAADLRADELSRMLANAERLPAQLALPTAFCFLPASVLLVGAPLADIGLRAAGAAW